MIFYKETEFKDTEIGRIPENWEVVKLEQVVEINKESIDPIKEIPNETFIYIDIDSIESSAGKIRNPKRILGRNAPSRVRRVIHENDVIMSTVRPYLKAFAIVLKNIITRYAQLVLPFSHAKSNSTIFSSQCSFLR